MGFSFKLRYVKAGGWRDVLRLLGMFWKSETIGLRVLGLGPLGLGSRVQGLGLRV